MLVVCPILEALITGIPADEEPLCQSAAVYAVVVVVVIIVIIITGPRPKAGGRVLKCSSFFFFFSLGRLPVIKLLIDKFQSSRSFFFSFGSTSGHTVAD